MNTQLSAIKPCASDPFERIAFEESDAAILKFAKGEWISKDIVLNNARVVAEIDTLAIGWRKWLDNKIVDANIGYVADGFQPKVRAELDNLDSNAWPMNTRGERTDPWQFGYYLRFTNEEGEVLTWSATSSGARKAVGGLTRTYASRRKRSLGGLPIVVLKTDFYRHKEFGKVDVPVLECVGWTDEKIAIAPPAANTNTPTNDIDDDIPF